jgi:manganese transport protein
VTRDRHGVHSFGRQCQHGLVGALPSAQYWYFVVGMIAAGMMPYEIYFYSSGGIEEGWTEKQLPVNRANALIGFPLGGLVAAALTVVAAQQLLTLQVTPQNLGTVLLEALRELGPIGFYAAVIGAFCAIGGATIDSAFSCAYNLAQHQRWPWARRMVFDRLSGGRRRCSARSASGTPSFGRA